MLASLSVNAYSLYLLHYVFDVWLQYALLPFALFAVVKGAIVFSGTVALSWITTLVVQRTTIGARLIGVDATGCSRAAIALASSRGSLRPAPAVRFTIGVTATPEAPPR